MRGEALARVRERRRDAAEGMRDLRDIFRLIVHEASQTTEAVATLQPHVYAGKV